jgi:ACS family allantoate permease-like MFS transporter
MACSKLVCTSFFIVNSVIADNPVASAQTDKLGLSTQATLGLRTDLHLVGNQYALLSTFFYVSYLAFEFPFAWLMQKVPIGKTLGVVMLLWGVDVLCMAWARHWVDLSVMRAIQGALECSISPAFLLIVGSFYTRQEVSTKYLTPSHIPADFSP